MNNKIVIGGTAVLVTLLMAGGTAMALNGNEAPASPEVRLASPVADTKPTPEVPGTPAPAPQTTTSEPPIGSVPVPSTIPDRKSNPVYTVPAKEQQSAPVSTPPTTSAPKTDPKVELRKWWDGKAGSDWAKFSKEWNKSCTTPATCQAFVDSFNAFSSDLVATKGISKDFYVNAKMPNGSKMVSCQVKGGAYSTPECSAATDKAIDDYLAFVQYLNSWGLPAKAA